jgi:hypothetical protein
MRPFTKKKEVNDELEELQPQTKETRRPTATAAIVVQLMKESIHRYKPGPMRGRG